MLSPWDQRVMPSGSPHPPPRSCSSHLHPRILCPSGFQLTFRVSARSMLKTDMSQVWEVAPEQQSGGADGGWIWGWGIHTHANNSSLCSVCTLAPGPTGRACPRSQVRVSHPPKAAPKCSHSPPPCESPPILWSLTRLCHRGQLQTWQSLVPTENMGLLVQKARKMCH